MVLSFFASALTKTILADRSITFLSVKVESSNLLHHFHPADQNSAIKGRFFWDAVLRASSSEEDHFISRAAGAVRLQEIMAVIPIARSIHRTNGCLMFLSAFCISFFAGD
jgi:hypothetical protein